MSEFRVKTQTISRYGGDQFGMPDTYAAVHAFGEELAQGYEDAGWIIDVEQKQGKKWVTLHTFYTNGNYEYRSYHRKDPQ